MTYSLTSFRSLFKRHLLRGLPWQLSGKESACNAGDTGSIPGSGRSPGEGNGNPLQYSCLENPTDRGAWCTIVHRVTKSQTRLSHWAHTVAFTWSPTRPTASCSLPLPSLLPGFILFCRALLFSRQTTALLSFFVSCQSFASVSPALVAMPGTSLVKLLNEWKIKSSRWRC